MCVSVCLSDNERALRLNCEGRGKLQLGKSGPELRTSPRLLAPHFSCPYHPPP